MKYEQLETFDVAAKVAEKKEEDMVKVPQPTVQSMAKGIELLTKPKLRKHPKVSFCMEFVMDQMINQMN